VSKNKQSPIANNRFSPDSNFDINLTKVNKHSRQYLGKNSFLSNQKDSDFNSQRGTSDWRLQQISYAASSNYNKSIYDPNTNF
jgi:hypothetical protein